MNGFFPEGWNTQATDSKKAFTPAFLADAKEKQTVLAGLETAGAILKYAPEFMESAECERLTGFLCMGMASDQMEVAQEIGISQAQVSRLEKNALRVMRNYLR